MSRSKQTGGVAGRAGADSPRKAWVLGQRPRGTGGRRCRGMCRLGEKFYRSTPPFGRSVRRKMAKRKRKLASKSSARSSADSHVVNTLGEVAEFFGMSVDTIRHWRTGPDPMPGIAGSGRSPGRFDLQEICRWRIAKMPAPKPVDRRDEAELKLLEANVNLRETRLTQLRSTLLDAGVMTQLIRSLIDEHSKLADELAKRIKAALPDLKPNDYSQACEHIHREVGELLFTMSVAADEWQKLLDGDDGFYAEADDSSPKEQKDEHDGNSD